MVLRVSDDICAGHRRLDARVLHGVRLGLRAETSDPLLGSGDFRGLERVAATMSANALVATAARSVTPRLASLAAISSASV